MLVKTYFSTFSRQHGILIFIVRTSQATHRSGLGTLWRWCWWYCFMWSSLSPIETCLYV